MKDKQLEKLLRIAAAKTSQPRPGGKRKFVDPTLAATSRPEAEDDHDNKMLFKEMKKREF